MWHLSSAYISICLRAPSDGVTAARSHICPLSSSVGHTQRQATINYTICLLFVNACVSPCDGLSSRVRLFRALTQICLNFIWDAIQSSQQIPQASKEEEKISKERERERETTKKGRNFSVLGALISSLHPIVQISLEYTPFRGKMTISHSLFIHMSLQVCVYATVSFRSLQLLFFSFAPFVETVYIYSAYVILFPCIMSAHGVPFRCELAIVFLMYQFENLFKIPKTYLLFVLVW